MNKRTSPISLPDRIGSKRLADEENWCITPSQSADIPSSAHVVENLLNGFYITCLSASPDSLYLAVGGNEGKVLLLELSTGKRMHVDHACGDSVKELVWSPDASKLVINCYSGVVSVWDRESDSFKRMLGMSASWSPTGDRICTSFSEGAVCMIWNVATGAAECKLRFREPPDKYQSKQYGSHFPRPKWCPNGNIILFVYGSSVQTVWKEPEGAKLYSSITHVLFHKEFLSWSLAGDKFATVQPSGRLRVCKADSASSVGTLEVAQTKLPESDHHIIAWRPDSCMLAVGTVRKQVILWDSRDSDISRVIDMRSDVYALSWSVCGELLFVATGESMHMLHVKYMGL